MAKHNYRFSLDGGNDKKSAGKVVLMVLIAGLSIAAFVMVLTRMKCKCVPKAEKFTCGVQEDLQSKEEWECCGFADAAAAAPLGGAALAAFIAAKGIDNATNGGYCVKRMNKHMPEYANGLPPAVNLGYSSINDFINVEGQDCKTSGGYAARQRCLEHGAKARHWPAESAVNYVTHALALCGNDDP